MSFLYPSRSTICLFLAYALSTLVNGTNAQLSLDPIFQNHMILQQNRDIIFRGHGMPGDNVVLTLGSEQRKVNCNEMGRWEMKPIKMEASGPHHLRVSAGSDLIEVSDIYFGDVWLCSGQSNMEWPVAWSNNAEEEIQSANDLMIRQLKIPLSGGPELLDTISGGKWMVATPENVGSFTAVGYYFAQEIRAHQDVPIGLLNSSWGGSRIEPWMSAESLGFENNEKAQLAMETARSEKNEQIKKELELVVGQIDEIDDGMADGSFDWAKSAVDYSDWKQMELPQLWEEGPLPKFDGIVWFKKEVQLTRDQIQNGGQLYLGKIDDSDQTFVNGKMVGETIQKYNEDRIYEVPSTVLREGKNIITVRVEDTGGGGGIYGTANSLRLDINNGEIDLSGTWYWKAGALYASTLQATNHTETYLYNHMIHPILKLPIKGILWYQGESNTAPSDAPQYERLLATLIQDWRGLYKSEDLPFLIVQLANFLPESEAPMDGGWPRVREAQWNLSQSMDHVGTAVIIDIGDAEDIHPRNKQDVGKRLSLAARHVAYKEDIIYEGPTMDSYSIVGSKIIITLKSGSGALDVRNKYGYINGFTICGEDQKWHWAKAHYDGENIVVTSDKVDRPVHVRYGWSNNPADLNLYNEQGLPASPFRTDTWEIQGGN